MIISHKFQELFKQLDTNKSPVRYIILIGGRGGAKSHALSVFLNQASYNKGWGILFTRWTMVSAEKSVIPEMEKIANENNLNNANDFQFLRTQVINKYSGVVIDYSGLKPSQNSSTGALKSLSNKNIFVLEEAEDCPSFEQFDKVDNSIRTVDHKNLVILSLNQGHISHWIFNEFFKEKRDDTLIIETTYLDNIRYLDKSFIAKANRVRERNLKRYNHIYLNEWKSDVDGALWLDKDISDNRITTDEFDSIEIKRAVIAYDPAVTDKTTDNEPDEDGIIMVAQGVNNHYYVLQDHSTRGTRSEIANLLANLYNKGGIDCIVIEKNNGGDFIPALIKSTPSGKYVRTKNVTATKGKALRAQPVQSRYEIGEVHHVGTFPELEYEMTSWIPDSQMASPNRLDALVWGLSFVFNNNSGFTLI